ncbi:hypothetical protein L7F22_002560 [Adiantum nelumboides]|nr:hypothetical protein [Adiantum nelumboides]
MAFPNFHGKRGENAGNFLDDLEMAFLVSGREDEEIKLRAFPLVLREEAIVWFQDLDMGKQGNWEALKRAFLLRYSGDNNPEEIWRKLSKLQQASPDSYSEYETQFLKLWTQWENSLPEGERAPNFLQKERFLAGLTPILPENVKCHKKKDCLGGEPSFLAQVNVIAESKREPTVIEESKEAFKVTRESKQDLTNKFLKSVGHINDIEVNVLFDMGSEDHLLSKQVVYVAKLVEEPILEIPDTKKLGQDTRGVSGSVSKLVPYEQSSPPNLGGIEAAPLVSVVPTDCPSGNQISLRPFQVSSQHTGMCEKRGAQGEASATGTMDSNMNRQFESQRDDEDPIFSQTALPHPNFYYPSFHLPPQSFQAMLNSPSMSPNSPFMFRPPHSPMVPQSPNPSPLLGVPNMESPPNPQGPQASLNSAPNPSLASQPNPSRGKYTKRKEPSNEEVVPETQLPVPKKTRASKKKVRVDLGEDDDNNNKKSKWLDFWVDQLIHVRGAMNDEFNNPGKREINLWAKVVS